MKFSSLFKIIRPEMKQKIDLIQIFSYEFLEAIQKLMEIEPGKKYMTRTWLVHKKGREYLMSTE